ncbi:hypothetical protein BpHYR1_030353 [Brachionus plicatilis]|uniref:Uncharacterized protein n=1 Tax=Brachionus plicatilis TaxID=10195 RepID=A0A3M7RBI3_BRAPC|nr:hypothetical protein BpHYR1_030353 [Brachionus plicatilis]
MTLSDRSASLFFQIREKTKILTKTQDMNFLSVLVRFLGLHLMQATVSCEQENILIQNIKYKNIDKENLLTRKTRRWIVIYFIYLFYLCRAKAPSPKLKKGQKKIKRSEKMIVQICTKEFQALKKFCNFLFYFLHYQELE